MTTPDDANTVAGGSPVERGVRRYDVRTIALAVVPDGEPLFSEMTTTVRIVDEAAGEYVEVEQHGRTDIWKIAINTDEWPRLRDAIDTMIEHCRNEGGA